MLNKAILPLVLCLVFISESLACTSAVISGSATSDGRPLLWKHRDTGFHENKLVYIEGERYDFVGVANLVDNTGAEIWMGSNSTGFSIMNTASYNLNAGLTCDAADDQEGLFMHRALEICATLEDFETLLDSSSGKWGLAANFGVIDAQGGAAYYETGYYDFKKYDACDSELAPDGYLLRTNFSFRGEKDGGYGFIRLQTTNDLFSESLAGGKLSVELLLEKATRNLNHSLLKTNIHDLELPADVNDTTFIPFGDYVMRYNSASTMVIQGVLPGEDPQLTTMWTILGWQLATLVTPVWVVDAEYLPGILISRNDQPAPLNQAALQLKGRCYPNIRGNGSDYLNLAPLMNKEGNGFAQVLLPAELEIIEETNKVLHKWRKSGIKKRQLKKFNRWLEKTISDIYEHELDLKLKGGE
ncbi:MAG: hypothetical protein U9Q77_08595 [Candidatus Marinimicrobia bacterium]|nr:hypothetical protein [Candidatus Neomarinimicrobiota bacterium]